MKFIREKLERYQPNFSPTVYKGALIAIGAAAFVLPLALVAVPYIEFFNGMAAQPKAKPQSLYGRTFGQDLIAERAAVPGTIPRHYTPYPYSANDDATAELAGRTLTNPVSITLESLQRGRDRYETFCIVCHGRLGLGDGPVVGPDRFPAPPSLHSDAVKKYKDGQTFHIITRGKGKMPPYADRISPQDRWQIVHYLRVLHRALDPKPEDLAP